MSALFRRLWSADPIAASVASLILGLTVTLASIPLNLALVTYQSAPGVMKQVGFASSLNWSASLVFLFPASVFTALWTVRRIASVLRDLPGERMLTDRRWSVLDQAAGDAAMAQVWRAAAPIGLFMVLIAAFVGGWDFVTVVWTPLTEGALRVAPGDADVVHEIDWSVAALLAPYGADAPPSVAANLAFAAVAYVLVVAQSALMLSFFAVLIGFAIVMARLGEGGGDIRLAPDARSSDRRRGFEVFEPVFWGVLIFSLLSYLNCYFMRVQNLFVRDPESPRIDELLFGYISDSLGEKIYMPYDLESLLYLIAKTLLRFFHAVFETGDLADMQSYVGVGMLMIGVFAVLLALFVALRSAAAESRRRAERAAQSDDESAAVAAFYGMGALKIRRRLHVGGVDHWPLLWPDLNSFLAYLALGLACFVFYRLALLWLAMQLWRLLRWRRSG